VALLDRVTAALPGAESRSGIDQWVQDFLLPTSFGYNGQTYPIGVNTSYGATRAQEIDRSLPGFASALRRCPPAFAAQMVRALVLSQVRFTFRNLPSSNSPRRTFGTRDLKPLEQPWANATTGELVTKMEWHAGLAGNSYVTNYSPGRLRVLRPDWTAIVYGSESEPEYPSQALDGKVLGYIYQNGGIFSSQETKPQILTVGEVAHWSPIPDPLHAGIGMSWVTPAIREIQADSLTTDHKIRFFENGATPNLVVKGLTAATREQFNQLVDMMEERHAGVQNAYRTLYLTQGADATVVGSDLSQIDMKSTQGAGETRISMLSRVHPVVLAASEGLQGSALNAGTFAMARRIWADTWILPTLQDLCAALAPLVNVPAGAELWYDTADVPILREDALNAAQIMEIEAATIGSLIQAGFTAESAVKAVKGQDANLLQHSGLVSVQLQQPGAGQANEAPHAIGGGFPKVSPPKLPRLPHVPLDAGLKRDGEPTDDELDQAILDVDEQRYDVSPIGMGKNWVTGVGGLPLFIRAIAHALIRNGHSESEAIQLAVGVVKNWASGEGHVTAKTRAKAAAALAEWEAKKAASHAKAAPAPEPAMPLFSAQAEARRRELEGVRRVMTKPPEPNERRTDD